VVDCGDEVSICLSTGAARSVHLVSRLRTSIDAPLLAPFGFIVKCFPSSPFINAITLLAAIRLVALSEAAFSTLAHPQRATT